MSEAEILQMIKDLFAAMYTLDKAERVTVVITLDGGKKEADVKTTGKPQAMKKLYAKFI